MDRYRVRYISWTIVASLRTTIPAIVGAFLLLPPPHAEATVIAGPYFYAANGHPYCLLDSKGWIASEAEAVALGGHLATINDQAENNWVHDTFYRLATGQGNLWIGLNDAAQEGRFVWVSGEPVTLTNWSPGEPNNGAPGNGEDYVQIGGSGFVAHAPGSWNDKQEDGLGSPLVTASHGVVEGCSLPPVTCAGDLDGDNRVVVTEILVTVNNALGSCLPPLLIIGTYAGEGQQILQGQCGDSTGVAIPVSDALVQIVSQSESRFSGLYRGRTREKDFSVEIRGTVNGAGDFTTGTMTSPQGSPVNLTGTFSGHVVARSLILSYSAREGDCIVTGSVVGSLQDQ